MGIEECWSYDDSDQPHTDYDYVNNKEEQNEEINIQKLPNDDPQQYVQNTNVQSNQINDGLNDKTENSLLTLRNKVKRFVTP